MELKDQQRRWFRFRPYGLLEWKDLLSRCWILVSGSQQFLPWVEEEETRKIHTCGNPISHFLSLASLPPTAAAGNDFSFLKHTLRVSPLPWRNNMGELGEAHGKTRTSWNMKRRNLLISVKGKLQEGSYQIFLRYFMLSLNSLGTLSLLPLTPVNGARVKSNSRVDVVDLKRYTETIPQFSSPVHTFRRASLVSLRKNLIANKILRPSHCMKSLAAVREGRL